MHVLVRVAAVVAAASFVAACASAAPDREIASTAAPTVVPTTAPTTEPTPTAEPTPAPTAKPTPVPTVAGPVVLASTIYPYRITVPSGSTSFVPSRVPWDGAQKLSLDSRETDRARALGLAVWMAMTDTTDDVDAVADLYEGKFRSWHGCRPATGRQQFDAGELKGVAWIHSCANGAQAFARAVVVGDGHALVAYAQGSTDMSEALSRLVELFGGLEWTDGG